MIRSFLPTDLIVILFQGGLHCNLAKSRHSLGADGARLLSLAALLVQCLKPRDRHYAWVWTDGLACRGLASVRNRSLPTAWEVDRLVLQGDDEWCCLSLLEKLCGAGTELGVERVFLRLPADSPMLYAAHKAGFSPYMTEYLYFRDAGQGRIAANGHDGTSALMSPRVKDASDDYRLFRLYEKCVPAHIRRVEGMTYGEWQAARETGVGSEWVFEEGGNLVGWLGTRNSHHTGQLQLMALPQEDLHQSMIECGLMFLNGCRHLYCLATEWQGELLRLLEGRGFTQAAEYSALAKELTGKDREPCLIPASA